MASAGRLERLMPHSSSPWLPVSTTECIASLSMAELPVMDEAMNLVTAMRKLPISAA